MAAGRWRGASSHLAVLALASGSALLLPGVIVERARGPRLEPVPAAGPVASFTLACDGGVLATACLRELEQLTSELESDARVAGPVRSLARAVAVRPASIGLRPGPPRVEPLVPGPPRDDTELRRLRARLREEPGVADRFLSADGAATFVIADLAPDLAAERARHLIESLRSRFDRPPVRLAANLELPRDAAQQLFALAAGAFGWTCVAVALALAGARLSATSALTGLAALAWFEGARAAGGASAAGADLGLALAAAVGAALPCLHRARSALRRGVASERALADGLALAAPPAVVGWLALAVSGALEPVRLIALAAALAGALLTAAALVSLLRGPDPQLRGLAAWLERGLLRLDVASRAQRGTLCALAAALAVAALAGVASRPSAHPASPAVSVRRWSVDAGVPGGALEPAFLERVEALRRELAVGPGVSGASSLVDAVLAPTQRAAHDGDVAFASVPPARADVEATLALFAAAAPRELAGRIDRARRRVAIETRIETRPVASLGASGLLLALAGFFALVALWLRSVSAGAIALVPAALAALAVGGACGSLERALLASLSAGACSLFVLGRARELARAGAERGVALSLALRESGRVGAVVALAGSGVAALTLAPAAGLALWLSALLGLALTPVIGRSIGGGAFAPAEPLRTEVSAVGALRRRGTDARG